MHSQNSVWIVDDDRSIRWVLEKALRKEQLEVESFDSGAEMLNGLQQSQPDAIISDIRMPGQDGLALLKELGTSYPEVPVIIMTAHSDLQSAVDSYEGGAFEYLPKPFDLEEVVSVTRRALDHAKQLSSTQIKEQPDAGVDIIGEAPAMQEVFRAIGRLARSNVTVLINGESGTGKELVARALHRHSPRVNKPFIALNMAAIPHDLIESELFGHEKGAFTGASTRREGRFEQAKGGTLFLDEIGDMPADAQTRLLRVLSDGEFYRVGGHVAIKADVRIITATHQNLEQLVSEHRFREDLFHRLNVIRVHIPKLSDRAVDIPTLAKHFLVTSAHELQTESKHLEDDTLNYLSQLPWPGNVRQLENVCRWLTVMAPGNDIHISDLPSELLTEQKQARSTTDSYSGDWSELLREWASKALADGKQHILKAAIPEFETALIETALAHTGGRKRDAAELLGWGRNTLTRKLKELDLSGFKDEP